MVWGVVVFMVLASTLKNPNSVGNFKFKLQGLEVYKACSSIVSISESGSANAIKFNFVLDLKKLANPPHR